MINLNLLIRQLQSAPLSQSETQKVLHNLLTLSAVQQAALLALLTQQLTNPALLLGALQWLMTFADQIDYAEPVLDIVGTGGDGLKTFNISTAASLVIASTGVRVAKHGGRNVTSLCGSTDVIEQLEIPLYSQKSEIIGALNNKHYVFIAAPFFNTALKEIGPLRKQLGFATLFNLLGPLANPILPKHRLIGVNQKELIMPFCQVLKEMDVQHAMVVHSFDGMDEFSINAPNYVGELKAGVIREYIINPQDYGIGSACLADLSGGSETKNATIIRTLFAHNNPGPQNDIVSFNAGAGLYVSGKVNSLQDGLALARQAIASGKTFHLLNQLNGAAS